MELEGWKEKSALVALVFVVVLGTLAAVVKSNRDRAEGWHRRAVAAEELVGGLHVVIGERSHALNQRTAQANRLVSRLDTTERALRQSKVSVGTLTRRQRELARENARVEAERRTLQRRQAALGTLASRLSACNKRLGGGPSAAQGKSAQARLASCRRAAQSLDSYLEQFG